MTNHQEFAYGLDPRLDTSVNPISRCLSGKQFSYTRRIGSGLTYTVYYSADLRTWSPDISATQIISGTHGDVDTVSVTLSSMVAPIGGRLFVRVQAE